MDQPRVGAQELDQAHAAWRRHMQANLPEHAAGLESSVPVLRPGIGGDGYIVGDNVRVVCESQQPLESFGPPCVIVVQRGDPLSLSFAQPAVHRAAEADVRFVSEHAHARVAGRDLRCDRVCLVT